MSLDPSGDRPEDVHDRRRTEEAVLQGLFGAQAVPDDATRYERIRALGQGAMGRVHLARDTKLSRHVALKTLSEERTADAVSRDRIRREAFALAQIHHPAVVGIHDVLEDGDGLTLVMEYVEGPTLRAWLEQGPPVREVAAVLQTTAEGIAAAHAQGIVHRDLKPENVIVQSRLRPKVIDFGLARPHGDEVKRDGHSPSAAAETITHTGAVLGTPAYMAPEQFLEADVDARADQFAFCVMAWEAFAGRRPFAGDSVEEITEAAARGRVDTSRMSYVPRHVRDALKTGLEPDPADRHPDMSPLVAALRPPRRWWRWGLPVLAGLAAVAIVSRDRSETRAVPSVASPCEDAGRAVFEVWTPARSEMLQAHLQSVSPAFGRTLGVSLASHLDRWAAQWSEQAQTSCRSHEVDPRQKVRHDSEQRCLVETLDRLDAFLELAQQVPVERVARLGSVLDGVPTAARCGRPAFVDAAFSRPPSPEQTKARALDRATRSALAAGDYPKALRSARRARAAVEPGRGLALDAELHASLARAHFQLGDTDAATRAFLDAANAAEACAHDELAASIWLELAKLAGVQRVDSEQTAFYLERAESAVRRLGDPPGLLTLVLQRRAQRELAAGKPQDARVHIQRGLEVAAEAVTADRLRASLAMDLGKIEYMRSDYDAASDAFAQAEQWFSAAYGDGHPSAADARHNLGSVLVAAGELERASVVLTAALEGRRLAYGPTHEKVSSTLNSLATIAFMRADYAAAASAYDEVAQLQRASRDGPHFFIGSAVANRGRAEAAQQQFVEANASFAEAVKILEQVVEGDDPRLADALSGWASSRLAEGNARESTGLYARALQIRTDRLGADAPRTLRTQIDLAGAERQAGTRAKAQERLAKVLQSPDLPAALETKAQLGLGWLSADRGAFGAARNHFAAAKEARGGAGEDAELTQGLEQAQAWLAAHPP